MTTVRLTGIRACVFDAYGTLFDVNSAAAQAQDALGERWHPLAELWRSKQLQYTWLRAASGRHADFEQVTLDSLEFAMASFGLRDEALRDRLVGLYLTLQTYAEVKDTLSRLKGAGQRLAILSNGTPHMLKAAASHCGISTLLDAVLSVEEVGVYKPHPEVYALATRRLQLKAAEICFVSSNGWDAYSAKAFGFHVVWCNRFGQAAERIPDSPDVEIETLAALPGILAL